ncbi:ribonucleoside-diphosphate reductase, adenosylcobalamin-dependent [Chloroherpeton thalassium ATCC 35110]|uniref:Vitamin B12-dependent ribonucleotide reductase n=1 Tax=Chloroherpeton thalassium (strain ATCC 35110 / GB-78) TaxID=517418 RepID=B3QY00_CHLT3|nr:intein-containing adenosylcobalamin-dependent ribonucleoside-diphosphate reductase [Chloroherpeton thalassium]ACF13528.1 ribonucleoside-diphosphate reductase, adenosylcobalamin-dependent [Chloroherpeton thalassium ATCC 35110]
MKILRRFSKPDCTVFDLFEYTYRSSVLRNPDGSTVFEMHNVEVPVHWSQVATDILAQKYFRKAGVPQLSKDGKPVIDADGNQVFGGETSIKQVVHRMAACWRDWGERYGYFDSPEDAQAYYDETAYMLLKQMAAPNSPQWFNTGLAAAYGISGRSQGHFFVDPDTGKLTQSEDSYTRPQAHACFIQSVQDDLVNEGGIFDLVVREARVFKFGSGTGTNFSNIRAEGEMLSGGGTSSGLMSFLKIFDAAAGAIKSGGTTRRAAKMVIVNIDHPDIEEFIEWKAKEEEKVAAMVAGSKINSTFLKAILHEALENGADRKTNPALNDLIQRALYRGVPMNYILRTLSLVSQGFTSLDFESYDTHYESEAYSTVSGQNSNNTIRLTNEFMQAVENDEMWELRWRTDGSVCRTVRAAELWNKIAFSAWKCADPGLQFDTTINEWHTCPNDGRINASNPCVTAETLVATDRGLERIGDLVGEARGIKSLDGKLHWVEKIFPTGTKPVYELKTKSGYRLKLTGDHLVFTENRGDVKACELTKDDVVRLVGGEFGSETTGSANMAQLIGLLTGDGCITRVNEKTAAGEDRRVGFLTLDKAERDVAEWANSFINELRPELGEHNKKGAVVETATTARVSVGSPRILEVMEKFAVLDKGSAEKIFTDSVFRLSRAEQAALLRGLFTADGTVANYGEKSQYVALDSVSLPLLGQVQLLLLNFGIKAKIYENRRAGNLTAILPDGKGGVKEYPVLEMHSLRISRSSRVRFEAEIGFFPETEKARKLAELNQSVAAYAEPLNDKIKSLEYIGEEPVFDLTEPETHHFVANGIGVHNCSEYMFLDDTACNLASLNLIHFVNEKTGDVDTDALRHAARVWTLTLEISVLMAQYPSPKIAQQSYDYRTLGLGFANLGSLLMVSGTPYDSPKALAVAGAISAIMTGEAYATSAEMAADIGAFPKFAHNRDAMLRVVRNHRHAAHNAPKEDYEDLSVVPMSLDPAHCPKKLCKVAGETWDRALKLGEKHGFRNAQVSVIAPTGCLVGGSLVATERGLVPLGSLGDTQGAKWQDADFKVMTDEGAKKATKFYINGVAKTRKIVTSAGYEIQGTPEHRIKVVDTKTGEWVWKRFGEIAKGDIVPLGMKTVFGKPQTALLPPLGELHWNAEPRAVAPEIVTPELAELVGYFMGDGSLHSKGLRFCVSKEDADVVQRLAELSRSLFNLEVHVEAKQGYIEVAIHSVRLTLWWQACGFAKLPPSEHHKGKGWLPRIPNAILYTNDTACYTAFLRGLFEADGTVTNGVPCWTSSQKEFALQVKSLMLALGFPTTTKEDISGWGQSTLYVLRLLNRNYTHAFKEKIGFMGERKQAAIITEQTLQSERSDDVYLTEPEFESALACENEQNALQLSITRRGAVTRTSLERALGEVECESLLRALNFYYDVVEDNEDGGEALTYDLSVPENVTYIANGFVSHNTIGLVMDCGTTGIEPDFAIVKFKKLAGGGYFKIVNQSVHKSLMNLGYSDEQIADIENYCKGHGTLEGAPFVTRESLLEKGFTTEKLEAVESQLGLVFDIKFAFNKWTLGEEFCKSLGFSEQELNDPNFDMLKSLGYAKAEIEAANDYICGTMMIEDAPHLKPEHLPVFDCASKCGRKGKRYIDYMAHVRMMAAVQPFISGAISKTVNMPAEATVEQIREVYLSSWHYMLKAIALYRDTSKLSQPLNSASYDDLDEIVMLGDEQTLDETKGPKEVHSHIEERIAKHNERRRLPKKRKGYIREAYVNGHKVFLRTGEYEDGTLGEIFIDMYKEGASFKGLLNCFAVLASKALQYGMPLEELVDSFTFTRFEPAGRVDGHEAIKNATSILDYVFRSIGYDYLQRTDFVHVKAVDELPSGNGHADKEKGSAVAEPKHASPAHPEIKMSSEGKHANKKHPNTTAPSSRMMSETQKILEARVKGYTGEQCPNCASMNVKQNGSCTVCEDCGMTSGCS